MRILVAGATGYVGSRLVPELLARGHAVRCLARRPERQKGRFGDDVEVVQGDVLDPATLPGAMEGIDAAYYLVHSLEAGRDFEDLERRAAANFASCARAKGLGRIVYLGGLGRGPDLSPHLRSRQEAGRLLAESGVPVVELRASVIIGAGSLSFEMIRALVERLPVMVTPRWVRRLAQPISIDDTVAYLVAALETPLGESAVYEIGGPDRASYLDLMREYAGLRGLPRLFLPVPVLTPRLSGLWLGFVTPLQARVGRKLVDSIRHDTVVSDARALRDFPVRPKGVRAAMAAAISEEDARIAATSWSEFAASAGAPSLVRGFRLGSRRVETQAIEVQVPPAAAFAPILRIGGKEGWYGADWAWRLRCAIDLAVGGVGCRRGRRDPEDLREGDVIGFWRVERLAPDRQLRLAAEMKLPGRAWLQFDVEPTAGGSVVRQTAIFDPKGVVGRLYWIALYPLHRLVFSRMLRGIARRSQPAPQDL